MDNDLSRLEDFARKIKGGRIFNKDIDDLQDEENNDFIQKDGVTLRLDKLFDNRYENDTDVNRKHYYNCNLSELKTESDNDINLTDDDNLTDDNLTDDNLTDDDLTNDSSFSSLRSLIVGSENEIVDLPDVVLDIFNCGGKLPDIKSYKIFYLINPNSFYKCLAFYNISQYLVLTKNEKASRASTIKKELLFKLNDYNLSQSSKSKSAKSKSATSKSAKSKSAKSKSAKSTINDESISNSVRNLKDMEITDYIIQYVSDVYKCNLIILDIDNHEILGDIENLKYDKNNLIIRYHNNYLPIVNIKHEKPEYNIPIAVFKKIRKYLSEQSTTHNDSDTDSTDSNDSDTIATKFIKLIKRNTDINKRDLLRIYQQYGKEEVLMVIDLNEINDTLMVSDIKSKFDKHGLSKTKNVGSKLKALKKSELIEKANEYVRSRLDKD